MRQRQTKQGLARMRRMAALAPRNRRELQRFTKVVLGLRVPERALVAGNSAPLDYLAHVFFEGREARGVGEGVVPGPELPGAETRDCVVWANRGGGKTLLGAAATLLDLLFKPGIQVRILGGSLEQSSKMYRYLLRLLEQPMLRGLVAGAATQRRVELVNGSGVEVLAQSQRSVRGTHVHKLRCDEVEEFAEEVWDAAQLVPRSGLCGGLLVRGSVEALSTMHRPFGLMSRLVEQVARDARSSARGQTPIPSALPEIRPLQLFRWCALDVIERCPAERSCAACVLHGDCQGRARAADGFMRVDDLCAAWARSGEEAWASEMLCVRPRVNNSVYPNFNPGRHVGLERGETPGTQLVGGMDFGVRSPLVMLWARVRRLENQTTDVGPVEVVEEYAEEGLTVEQHLRRIQARNRPLPAWLGVDPAGGQRNSQTGQSDVQVLRRHGYTVRVRRAGITYGIERIRSRLDHGTLRIDPSCRRLIEALTKYHFDPENSANPKPVKDGPDHFCDALRYLIVNLDLGSGRVAVGRY